jgi:putative peptide zinc metalloprotease protein
VAHFIAQNQLAEVGPRSAKVFAEMLQRRRGSIGKWLLHNYLFFRIPLIKPDKWLADWSSKVQFFYSRLFFQLTLAAAALGLMSIYREWDHYSNSMVEMFSLQGMAAYGVTLMGVKILHEFGHGFTAKRYGCRVPTMGLAFLVMWPVAYTDTNEVWKLTDRRQRLNVAAAGIATELIIAAWATLAWMWLPEGGLKTAAFLLSSTTWVSTIAINASPFMRFDGYFLVSDYLMIPNLHGRSFALARWDLRERLFNAQHPVPEQFSPAKHKAMILFAWATWIYRLVLFLGIAALVYHFFIKALGILLFLVEIIWFVSLPIWMEVKVWKEFWPEVKDNARTKRSITLASIVLALFIIPIPTRITGSGLLYPEVEQVIYAPQHAQVSALPNLDQAKVKEGSLVIGMSSPDITSRTEQAEAKSERLAWQSASAGFDLEQKKDWGLLNEQLQGAEAEQSAVTADAARYLPKATTAGTLRDLDPDIKPGMWLAQRELVGRVISPTTYQVVSYVDDEDVQRISVGDRGLFIADGMAGPNRYLEVTNIDKDASRVLKEGELAGLFGGSVQVREKNGTLFAERAVYRVVLKAEVGTGSGTEGIQDSSLQQHRWRGHMTIAGNWEPLGLRFLKHALTVFWREAGF